MTTWDQMWTLWVTEYREIRPPGGPIGWYNLTDMKAAFDAGRDAAGQAGKLEIIDRLNAVFDRKN